MHEPDKSAELSFNLGQWVGRREAFGLIAGRCSASDVEILRKIRDNNLHAELGLNWDEFCTQKLHAARRSVDREIGYLRKHGPAFFVVRQLTRISVREYETIAGHISEQGVNLDGKLIAASAENNEELTAAIGELVKRCAPPEPAPEAPAAPPYDSLLQHCQGTAGLLRGFAEALSEEQKAELANVVADIRAGALLLGAIH